MDVHEREIDGCFEYVVVYGERRGSTLLKLLKCLIQQNNQTS